MTQDKAQATETLTGYLGGNIEIRDSQARWEAREATRWDPVAEMEITEEVERYRRSRPYGRVSLACHRWEGGEQVTRWVQLVVWDLHRMDRFHARLARKGDRVRVEGYPQTFTYITPEGETKELERFIVTRYETLRRKASNGFHLSNRHLKEAAAAGREAPEPERSPEVSKVAAPRRAPRGSFRSTYTTRATVEGRAVRTETGRGPLVLLEARTAAGRRVRAAAPPASPLGEALAWLEVGDAVRLSFERRGSFPVLVNVAWDWERGEPAERQSSAAPPSKPEKVPARPAVPRQASRRAPTLDAVTFAAQVVSDPETRRGWRAVTVETDEGEVLRVGAQLGTSAAGELARMQEGDRLRVEGRRLRGERIHAQRIEPVYLRGAVPTFTREQAERLDSRA